MCFRTVKIATAPTSSKQVYFARPPGVFSNANVLPSIENSSVLVYPRTFKPLTILGLVWKATVL